MYKKIIKLYPIGYKNEKNMLINHNNNETNKKDLE